MAKKKLFKRATKKTAKKEEVVESGFDPSLPLKKQREFIK